MTPPTIKETLLKGLPTNEEEKKKAESLTEKWKALLAQPDDEPEFELNLPDNHLISRYVRFHQTLTDSYPEYHFALIIKLILLMTQRKLQLNLGKKRYLNFWLLLMGISGYSRKSEAAGYAEDLLIEAIGSRALFYPTQFSTEKIADHFADTPTGTFWYDEFVEFLEMTGSRSYLAGFKGLLTKLFTSPEEYFQSFRKGEIRAKKVCPFVLGLIQPETFVDQVRPVDLLQGFLLRFSMLFPTRRKDWLGQRPLTDEDLAQRTEMATWLRQLYHFFTQDLGVTDLEMQLSEDSLKYYHAWGKTWEEKIFAENQDPTNKGISSAWARLQQTGLRLAIAFVLGDPEFLNYIQLYRQEQTRIDQTLQTPGPKPVIQPTPVIQPKVNKKVIPEEKKELFNEFDSFTSLATKTPEPDESNGNQKSLAVEKSHAPIMTSLLDQETDWYYPGGTTLKVPLAYLKVALNYVETLFLPHTRKILKLVSVYQDADKMDALFDTITKKPGISRAQLLRSHRGMKAKDFDEYLDTMRQAKTIREELVPAKITTNPKTGKSKGGRAKMTYYAIAKGEEDIVAVLTDNDETTDYQPS